MEPSGTWGPRERPYFSGSTSTLLSNPTSNLILDDKRFREHLPTIRALEKSRVVIVTHQSRPGKKDFTTLEAHAEKLEQLLGKPVLYVDSIFGSHAREAVHAMKAGPGLMLETSGSMLKRT